MNNDFLCDLPWIHLSVFPHGTTAVCCEAIHTAGISHGYNMIDGHKRPVSVSQGDINKIVNSESYRQIRLDMLEGKVPAPCANCKRYEDAGATSRRMKDSRWEEDWSKVTAPDGSITPDFRHLELRLGNLCNLKCRSCNAESSTKWITDYDALKDQVPLASGYDSIRRDKINRLDWSDSDEFYDSIAPYINNLELLSISGGEPFLITKHFKLLQMLKDMGLTNITLSYHTNLAYNVDDILEDLTILNSFDRVMLNCSIDDIGDRNTYIRHPADWEQTIESITKLKEALPNVKLIVCQTVNAYNFLYIEELYDFLKDKVEHHYLNHVHSPDYLTPYIIAPAIRKEKIDSIKDKLPEAMIDGLARYLSDHYYEDKIEVFNKFNTLLDARRSENFSDTFPKLYNLLNK